MQKNYPGFKAKVNATTLASYNANSKKYEAIIQKVNKPAYCEYYLLKWLQFFKDKHIQIKYDLGNSIEENDTTQIRKLNANAEIIPIDSIQFVKKLQKQKGKTIEGIYTEDSTYTIAIVKSKNIFRDYAGVILSSRTKLWRKGEVKLELKQTSDSTFDVISYWRNHTFTIDYLPFKLYKNGDVDALSWKRIYPKNIENRDIAKQFEWADKYDADYKNLSADISFFKIHSFDCAYASEIDSVVKANMNQIKKHKYMIIDLRNNFGGCDYSYSSLVPILYSNPVIEIGVDVYSTPDNIKASEENAKNPEFPLDIKKEIDSIISVMQTHPNQFVNIDNNDTIKMDSIMPYPQKIVVLANRYCGSTTEQFLLYAKDCKKVTLMGENTDGELDYSNLIPVAFPYDLPGTFYYPYSLSRRIALHQGIDGIGIAPTIKLSQNTDWIKEAEKYLLQAK